MSTYPMPLLESLPANYLLHRVADLLLGEGVLMHCQDCGRDFRSVQLLICGQCAVKGYAQARNARRRELKNERLGRHVCCDCGRIEIRREHKRCSACAKVYQIAYHRQWRQARGAAGKVAV